jgi:glutaredoxin 3
MPDVEIYTTPTCGYCRQAKSYLDELGVAFTEHDVSRDRAAAEEMIKLTGQMGVPVIVVGGQVIIGFDRARLQQLLADGRNHKRPRLGLKVADASSIARKAGEPPLLGALVGAVAPSSAGEQAGVRVGDIITSIDRKRVNNTAELEETLRSLTSGNRITVTYYRDDKAIKSEIVI